MTHDLLRLQSEVRELRRWYAADAPRLAWLEDRMAQVLAGMGEPCTRVCRPIDPAVSAPVVTARSLRIEVENETVEAIAAWLRGFATNKTDELATYVENGAWRVHR